MTTPSPTDCITRIMARMQREQEIHCPFCDEAYDDDDYRCVSYHGDGTPVELECLNEDCGRPFLVMETVRRTYETKPMSPSK